MNPSYWKLAERITFILFFTGGDTQRTDQLIIRSKGEDIGSWDYDAVLKKVQEIIDSHASWHREDLSAALTDAMTKVLEEYPLEH